MKNIIITYLLLLIPSISFAEFARIVDADGYVNVREGSSLNSRIVGRLPSGNFVYILDEEIDSPWIFGLPNVNVNDNNNDDEPLGFIHKSRIKRIVQSINSIQTIPINTINEAENKIELSDDHVNVKIETEVFDYTVNAHKFTKVHPPESPQSTLFKAYKGKPLWGTDGTKPQNSKQYKSITVKIGNHIIDIPKDEFESLFNVGIYNTDVYFEPKTNSLYIEALNSDGAGSYAILFAIEQGRYVGKTIVRPF